MSDKLDMTSPDLVSQNIEKIAALFPNCVTESANGLAIDFDQLKQELSNDIVEGNKERYRLEWPGKREAIVTANLPINKTLRPAREESVDFDNTENLYIEGDNLEVLKLLQESYLGKIKMIYIDPPYNTGKDFVYKDNFTQDTDEYQEEAGLKDEYRNRLVANPETSGRYHSDWLTMMYPRLKLAKNLLTDDGVIFISIDDHEIENLKKICNEIFGEENFRNYLLTRRRIKSLNVQFADDGLNSMNIGYEFVLVYSKSQLFSFKALRMNKENIPTKGKWNVFWSGADRPTMRYDVLGFTPRDGQWRWSKEKAQEGVKNYQKYLTEFAATLSLEDYWIKTGETLKFIRRIPDANGKNGGVQYWLAPSATSLRTSNWTDIEVSEIHKEFDLPFENPKSTKLIKTLIDTIDDKDFIVLDFFSGSATTAHSVFNSNSLDNGNRKFIMVQVPEQINESSEAYKAGYKTLCDIGKERIRKASFKINEKLNVGIEKSKKELDFGKTDRKIDLGFRVYKIDSSNMQDVYYTPNQYEQGQLDLLEDNIKPDRNSDDLVAQIMLDWGLPLSLKIEQTKIANKEVFKVADDALLCCFDEGIDEAFAKEIATLKPLRIVFRDKSFKDDTAKENVKQLLKQLSPDSEMKVI
ncbi:site-specific DNA-methyltransferase [Flavobacterium psychrophilum]|uniref:site-specific DNA-methyltransferase n=1 Tax=Flavobacterium psychrophilum TaxID=96345 RepID=UPI000B7C3B31|nr:site-specific DNA-methyltransferase [Flavobacterium psychrophilum]SNA85915.1 Type III restriction-modification system methylation subunit [Flavobacterium psychrophilum]